MLYKHSKNFFKDKIGDWYKGKWFTDGSDDSHTFEVIPYQITKKQVVAASNRKINIFLGNDLSTYSACLEFLETTSF